jgi:hypothetical protein
MGDIRRSRECFISNRSIPSSGRFRTALSWYKHSGWSRVAPPLPAKASKEPKPMVRVVYSNQIATLDRDVIPMSYLRLALCSTVRGPGRFLRHMQPRRVRRR